jgi:hypothetical protein
MSNRTNVCASIDRPSKIYHPDTSRQCQHTDCNIRLSKYNPTTYCSTHERYTLPPSKAI